MVSCSSSDLRSLSRPSPSTWPGEGRAGATSCATMRHTIAAMDLFVVPTIGFGLYLIRDQDRAYGTAVTRRLRTMGIRDKPIAPGSPWQNAFAERLIGSIRREFIDHVVVLGEA